MIDPTKLAAFAQPETPAPSPMDDETMDDETPGADKFGELRPALEEFAIEIEECCDELDPEALRNPGAEMDPTDIELLKIGVESLDPRLQQALQATQGISPAEAADIGLHLEQEGLATDGDRLGGWLYRVGQYALTPSPAPMETPMEPTEATPAAAPF